MYDLYNLVIKASAPLSRRRSDPVARYHEMNKTWKRDSFLNPSVSSNTLVLNRPVVVKSKKMVVNDYVIPTTKPRRKLCWQVRTALASTL